MPKHIGENFVNEIRHKFLGAFVAYLYILDQILCCLSNF
jgi:hypothetical protein